MCVYNIPTKGYVKTSIWPAYEGSVNDSGYPTIPVLKTTSPLTDFVAPNDIPLFFFFFFFFF